MAKKHAYRSRKNRGLKGGGYSFGAAVAPEAPYASTVLGGNTPGCPDCLDATRPGLTSTLPGTGGLPGFSGGFLASMLKPTSGGRYTVDLSTGPINGIGSAGPSSGMATISRIGCEGGLVNTSPPGALANPSPLLQNGGLDTSASYTAPTAGYGNMPSSFVDSVGAPVQLQIPYDARIANPACLKTGGGRKYRKTPRRQRKTLRKSRKSHRKSRK